MTVSLLCCSSEGVWNFCYIWAVKVVSIKVACTLFGRLFEFYYIQKRTFNLYERYVVDKHNTQSTDVVGLSGIVVASVGVYLY